MDTRWQPVDPRHESSTKVVNICAGPVQMMRLVICGQQKAQGTLLMNHARVSCASRRGVRRRSAQEAARAERKRRREEQIEGQRAARARVAEAAAGDLEMSEAELRAARRAGHERTAAGRAQQHNGRSAQRRAARVRRAEAPGGAAEAGGDGD